MLNEHKDAVVALAMAFGNYRAALVEADYNQNSRAHAVVVGSGEALLSLQRALGVEVAREARVREAIEYCRNCIEGDDWEVTQ